ncbi:hypothetical protein LINPERHAP2_LOCUS27234, partial [Linum perenne]
LGTTITLQTPLGEEWIVDIIHDNNGTKQFTVQWNDLYSFNSLKLGHFMLFKHNGNNHFSVTIFDTSTYEIDYSIRNPEIFNNQPVLEVVNAATFHSDHPFFKLELIRCRATATEMCKYPHLSVKHILL